ncbi:MAG: SgcJ/EcaC family oxidoreductase [Gemmatimonadaceae bacterium]|nr:SgcJ/EcaC family oxidoreductase [Gemmatimonadaceae bacterium]
MKHSDRWNAGLALAAAAIISACAPAVMVNQQSEEQAIRAVNNESMAAFAARDADRVAAIYAPDGVLMTPNSPLVSGQSAVRASHAEFFKMPGLSVNWTPTRIDVTSPTTATEIGTYRTGFDTPSGRVNDNGNYTTSWRKINGQWKVASDAVVSAVPMAMPMPMPMDHAMAMPMDAPTMEMHASNGLTWRPFQPAGFPAGAKIALMHGDRAKAGDYALRVTFPDGYEFPVHWHTSGEHVTVLSGTFLIAMGGSGDRSAVQAHGPGSFLYMPARTAHYGGARGETTVQLHGNGPFKLTLGTP